MPFLIYMPEIMYVNVILLVVNRCIIVIAGLTRLIVAISYIIAAIGSACLLLTGI